MKYFKKSKELFKEVLSYIKLLLISAMVGGVIAAIWYVYFWEYFKISPEDSQISGTITNGILVFSAILPIIVLTKVSEQFSQMTSAKDHGDYASFRVALKKTIPGLIHIIMVTLSLLAVGSVMMVPYKLLVSGLFNVFGISFIHSFFIIAAIQLDNPSKGLITIKIPAEWKIKLAEDDEKEKQKELED